MKQPAKGRGRGRGRGRGHSNGTEREAVPTEEPVKVKRSRKAVEGGETEVADGGSKRRRSQSNNQQADDEEERTEWEEDHEEWGEEWDEEWEWEDDGEYEQWEHYKWWDEVPTIEEPSVEKRGKRRGEATPAKEAVEEGKRKKGKEDEKKPLKPKATDPPKGGANEEAEPAKKFKKGKTNNNQQGQIGLAQIPHSAKLKAKDAEPRLTDQKAAIMHRIGTFVEGINMDLDGDDFRAHLKEVGKEGLPGDGNLRMSIYWHRGATGLQVYNVKGKKWNDLKNISFPACWAT